MQLKYAMQTKGPSSTTIQTKVMLWKMWWTLTITNTVNKNENINGVAARYVA